MKRLFLILYCWSVFLISSFAQASQNLYQIGIRWAECLDERLFKGCSDQILEDWSLFLKKESIQTGRGILFFNSLPQDRQDGLRIANARASKGKQDLLLFFEDNHCFSEADKKTFAIIAQNTEEATDLLLLRMMEQVKNSKKRQHTRLSLVMQVIHRQESFILELPER